MTEVFQCRLDTELAKEAKAVAEEIGLSTGQVVRLCFQQMVKRRAIPFPLQADALEDEILSSPKRRNQLAEEF
jgi:addiction module RelB/DinJ family antitoxin